MKTLELAFVWGIRMRFCAEGGKLRAEGDKLRAEGSKLWAEGDKLWAEGDNLWAEGANLWAEAILEAHGNIGIEWKNWSTEKQSNECYLETGEVFKP